MIFIVSIPISVVGKMSEKSATTITQLITSNNTRAVKFKQYKLQFSRMLDNFTHVHDT